MRRRGPETSFIMHKAVIFLSCLACLAAAGSSPAWEHKVWWGQNIHGGQLSPNWGRVEHNVHEKQKFLLDVLLQVHKPLVNAELVNLGKELITEPAAYQEPSDEILLEFLEKARQHAILGQHEIYTDLNLEHGSQLVGLAKFLTLAKDWPTFQRNVCFARRHWNPVLLVNALKIAVSERPDTQELIMPAMNEILPQLFYNKDVIAAAENVEWSDLVSKTTSTKPSLWKVLGLGNIFGNIIGYPVHLVGSGKTGLWRSWQERRMGMIPGKFGGVVGPMVEQEAEEQPENIFIQSEEKIVIPVEQQTPLSYFTDDVALNAFWNDVIVERMVQTETGGVGQQIEHVAHVNPRHHFSQKQQKSTPTWWGGHLNEGNQGHILTVHQEKDVESPENWMFENVDRFNTIRNGRSAVDFENEQDLMDEIQGRMMNGNMMETLEDTLTPTNAWSIKQGKAIPSGLFRKTSGKHMMTWGVSPKKHGQTSWWHQTSNVPRWGQEWDIENDDDESTQQRGWMQGQTGTNEPTNKQQQTGRNWYNTQQNNFVSGDDWMIKPTFNEEVLQQLGTGQSEDELEIMQQLGLGTQNWKNFQRRDLENIQELGKTNKRYNPQQTGWQHHKGQLNMQPEHQWHSRQSRSIKTIDISPEDQLMSSRRGEIFVQNIQQLAARINLEKISLESQSAIQASDYDNVFAPVTTFGVQSQLLTTTGAEYKKWVLSPAQIQWKIEEVFQKLQNIIDSALKRSQVSRGHPDIVNIVGEYLVADNGKYGNIANELYNEVSSAVYGVTAEEGKATPLSIPAANLRDPVYHVIVAALSDLIDSYAQQIKPYAPHQLNAHGVQIRNVEVDDLVTYFDVKDADLINLVDQQLLQSNVNNLQKLQKKLVARQQHLNHKQFNIGYDIHATHPQHVVVRTFLGPKINENGPIVSLEEARQHHILLDAFTANLGSGLNHIERNSREITWTKRDTTTLSEIYRHVLQGLPIQELVGSDCRFPHRLILPQGTHQGLPMQLFVVVTAVTEEDHSLQQSVKPEGLCGIGIAAMHLDHHPLNFPLDRKIAKLSEFLQPNMFVKNVEIFHGH